MDCGHPLSPKISVLGTRFFAHFPDSPDTCPLKALESAESPEHKRLKLEIYRAARRVSGWDADLEVRAPDVDPITGKPVIVDVVATRTARTALPAGTRPLQGWEVQLSAIGGGQVLERQELRDRWLGRCTWVTRDRPAWADKLPWYQIALAEEGHHPDLVVGGVVRWDAGRGDFVNEDPFPAKEMVRYILRRARWVQDVGWELAYADGSTPRQRQRSPSRRTVRAAVDDYCSRLDRLPAWARAWTEADWLLYAPVALERRDRGERLSVLDEAAIARCPALHEPDDLAELPVATYDNATQVRPCILCGQIVRISAAAEFPVHHHCAWHVARGDACEYEAVPSGDG